MNAYLVVIISFATSLAPLIGFTFPSVPLNGSPVECAGGWNSNFLLFRNSNGTQSNLSTASAALLVTNLNKITKTKIKKIKQSLKEANSKTKKKLKKELSKQNGILQWNKSVFDAMKSCYAGDIVAPTPAYITGTGLIPSSSYSSFGGGEIYAYDGQFLGILSSNSFNSFSINNSFGSYGSKFSSTSMFNQFGQYGGLFATMSPFNKFTQYPPTVYIAGQPVAYITVNQFVFGARIDPKELFTFLGRSSDIP
jgi:hypothetical protein